MEKEKIILIGGGGHCRSCIDIIEKENRFEIYGILDLPANIGQEVLGYPIIGSDEDLDKLMETYDNFLITLGHKLSASVRLQLYNKLKSKNKILPTIISPLAHVSRHASIGEGSIIMHGAIINSSATIGSNCIINTSAIIEHDVTVGSNCHVSSSSVINGGATIGEQCFIASNVVLRDNIVVGDNVIIGMGSVVVVDAIKRGVYFGSPAKFNR
ncbi:acetyltransferase [Vicingaceae bacterium]|nr:acetyltransferase [Vicingaceae bacterium]